MASVESVSRTSVASLGTVVQSKAQKIIGFFTTQGDILNRIHPGFQTKAFQGRSDNFGGVGKILSQVGTRYLYQLFVQHQLC